MNIRKNAWDNGGTLDANSDLLWYAKGVGEMQSRALDDKSSWWFFAAIHGQYISETDFPGWGKIPMPPSVPTTPLPTQNDQELYWDQCQHQSWFFPPWHRGYLVALEAQVLKAIVALGGPTDWTLPYWNYFGSNNQHKIPPAFTAKTLPDGSPNPLFISARYGPKNDGNIYIPIPPVSQNCLGNTLYTGSNMQTPNPGFGGPKTGFSHGGGTSGNLESNPHNQVHVDVGGSNPQNNNIWGLMSDPGIAALDPIFYLHHCNIDRMWAAWNKAGNTNPIDGDWLNGPESTGQRKFAMPMPDGSSWVFSPDEVDSLSKMNYTYDDLQIPQQITPPVNTSTLRLKRLGVAPTAIDRLNKLQMDSNFDTELMGSHDNELRIDSSGAQAIVKLAPNIRKNFSSSLLGAAEAIPNRAYLELENVRGTRDAHKLNVYVNEQLAGNVSLFGLRRASLPDGEHGGSGLNFLIDITDVIDTLHLSDALNDSLNVQITPQNSVADQENMRVGRVSIYRESIQG